ncbi:glycosyltransferase family 2 protein [Congregicoccus parvus]|uniref:glycosyltransferase family 2 protein n=1 Tax=Congregicoccus parvus TaxID=3081749 RepID=UPI003FA57EA5
MRKISIVMPCYNEAGNVSQAIGDVHDAFRFSEWTPYLIVVVDGSRDSTYRDACKEAALHGNTEVVELLRNFGQSQAYQAGFDRADGEYVLTISADNEIPARALLEVLRLLETGADFVNAAREDRWRGGRAVKSRLANLLLNRIAGLDINDRGSGVKGMRIQIAKALQIHGEWHRFLPELASLHTERIIEFTTEFRDRTVGVSAYANRSRGLAVFLDLLQVAFTLRCRKKPYSWMPGRLFGFSGLLIASVGGSVAIFLAFQRVLFGNPLADRPLFMVGILLAVLGSIMLMLGLIGELLLQVLYSLGSTKQYAVRRTEFYRVPTSTNLP